MSALGAALTWTERLVALAVTLQTLELWQIRRAFADDGVWRWSILREEHAALPLPLRWAFRLVLPYRRFLALLGLRLVLAATLAAGALLVAPVLWFTHLAVGARFRGSFNGGSDYMTSVLLGGLTLAACSSAPLVVTAGLAYIAAELVLSYFIAGVVKLRQPAWRSGAALPALLGSSRYGVPPVVLHWVARPALARTAALGVLAFECGFPLAWCVPGVALPWLCVGACFHLANAWLFGLNRFFFAWIAAYPAVLFFAARVPG